MDFRLKNIKLICSMAELEGLPQSKLLINSINAYSYNNARKDPDFAEALTNGDALIPDGMSIVKACKWLNACSQPEERIAGWDLFTYEMSRLNNNGGGKVMFVGSSEEVLQMIRERAHKEYPATDIITYSPPYKKLFSADDDKKIIDAINEADPDLLWIGMTAPKQEKWTYQHWNDLDIRCHCGTIGAVFDFFAGTTKRAPLFWQQHGLEWLYRFIKEPRRLWRRYILGNAEFICHIIYERFE